MKKITVMMLAVTSSLFHVNAEESKNSSSAVTQTITRPMELYMAALVGYSRMSGKFSNTLLIPAVDEGASIASGAVSNGFTGSVLLGARKSYTSEAYNSVFFGFDLEFGGDNQILKTQQIFFGGLGVESSYSSRLQRTFFILPSLLAGLHIRGDFFGFFKLGLGVSNFVLERTNYYTGAPAAETVFSDQRSKFKIAFVPALGLEYRLDESFSLLTQVSYEFSQKVDELYESNVIIPADAAGASARTRVNPNILNVKIGFKLKI